jgi:glycosyltransferase involved in cell wall biosynthesis
VDVGCPQVTTIHDLAEYDPEGGRQYSRLRLVYRKAALRSVMSRSKRILTVSDHAARGLRSRFPERSGDIRVVRNGCPETNPIERTGPACYLTAGRIHRHKNLMTLCRAYIQSDRSAKMDLPLVILGGDGNASGELKAYVEGEGYGDKILFKGYVSEAGKGEWYAKAKAFLFPSRFEGFGIPVLEAMAQGVPVICSNAASLPEVSGEAALSLDPADAGAWAGAFASLRDGSLNLENMSRSGRANVERFSWKASTEAMAGVFKELSDGFAPAPRPAMNKAGA